MKATKQYFPEVLFIMPYRRFQLLSMWMKPQSVTIQLRKADKQYFPVVLFIVAHGGSNF